VKSRGAAGATVPAVAVVLAVTTSLILLTGCATAPVPVPVGLSAAQRSTATRDDLNERWAEVTDGAPTFLEPKVAIIRYLTFRDDSAAIVACLRKSGYPMATVNEGVIVDPALTPPEVFPFTVARFTCEARYPEDPIELGYMTSDQEHYLYDYWKLRTVPCLRAQGVGVADLAPIEMPGVASPSVINLNPFLSLRAPAGASVALLEARCPPFPGELYPR
jgi:hypothetical protein